MRTINKPKITFRAIPDDALAFSPSPITISESVLSAHTSSCSLAAALNVSPAAISIWYNRKPGFTEGITDILGEFMYGFSPDEMRTNTRHKTSQTKI